MQETALTSLGDRLFSKLHKSRPTNGGNIVMTTWVSMGRTISLCCHPFEVGPGNFSSISRGPCKANSRLTQKETAIPVVPLLSTKFLLVPAGKIAELHNNARRHGKPRRWYHRHGEPPAVLQDSVVEFGDLNSEKESFSGAFQRYVSSHYPPV